MAAPPSFAVRRAAAWTLAAYKEAVPVLKEFVKPAVEADKERVQRLINDLDSDSFAVRQKAEEALTELGEGVAPTLREILKREESPQVKQSLGLVLSLYHEGAMKGVAVTNRRVAEVLEHIGSKEARELLQTWSKGQKEASLTRYAKAALERMGDK
jgi:HEAT repeat protein